tara:strand:- start:342 stop:1118 length:777 start_codon:yes stop_codon:yes gene_type:complete
MKKVHMMSFIFILLACILIGITIINRYKSKQNHLIKLINNIITLKSNPDYRLSDVINKLGHRWKHSSDQVLANDKYRGTILQRYLKTNGVETPKDLNLLLEITDDYIKKHNIILPTTDELVIHIRAGDVVEHDWFLKRDYVQLIRNTLSTGIKRITIVTAFAYQAWSNNSLSLKKDNVSSWEYTEAKQTKNKRMMLQLLTKIHSNFPFLELNIHSNSDIDKDLCYCVRSTHFIKDKGGFSELLEVLNKKVLHRSKFVL